ncbi:hypothetical protein Bbelb_182550 [Branchiostoma belcheri]|nr:hypothetical protein Bbelb_182550 [Branchiostoma belcheri]
MASTAVAPEKYAKKNNANYLTKLLVFWESPHFPRTKTQHVKRTICRYVSMVVSFTILPPGAWAIEKYRAGGGPSTGVCSPISPLPAGDSIKTAAVMERLVVKPSVTTDEPILNRLVGSLIGSVWRPRLPGEQFPDRWPLPSFTNDEVHPAQAQPQ